MQGNTEPPRQDQDMGKVTKVARPNQKKASKTIGPHSAGSEQGTLNFHTIEYGTRDDRPSDDGSRRYKKSKRNHHYPEVVAGVRTPIVPRGVKLSRP